MNRFLTIIVAMLLLGGTMLFAGGGREDGAQATNPTDNPWTDGEDLSGNTVTVFGAFVDTDAERFAASMVPFEEQTGIDVVYEGSGDFESLISVRVEGGDPPDLAAFPQPGLAADLTRRGFVLDIRDWFDPGYLNRQYSSAWIDLSTVDGQIIGVWYRASLKSLVWYAKPVFDREGYTVPETWDELLALSAQMVSDGYVPWSIGIESSGATGWVATDWIEDILLRTAPPSSYDAWVAGDLKFNSPEVRRAIELMSEIWFNPEWVLGGRDSILTVPFGDGATPLVQDPPRALMHRQATFIAGFLPDAAQAQIGEVIDVFYLPPIDREEGRPVLGAGDLIGAFNDEPATQALMRYLSTGESTRAWAEAGGFISPHNDAELSWHSSYVDRRGAEIIRNADTFRFDGSDLMPGAVGAGTFWTGMVDYVSGEDLDSVLDAIDRSFP